jgi:hypothetical protein
MQCSRMLKYSISYVLCIVYFVYELLVTKPLLVLRERTEELIPTVTLCFTVISILIALVIYPVCFAAELNEGKLISCRIFHSDEFHHLNSVPYADKMLKATTISWVRHIVHI